MSKTRLLQAVCAVAMMGAVPAFAQNSGAGMTGPNGQPNAADQQAPNSDTSGASNKMAPGAGPMAGPSSNATMGNQSTQMDNHSTHRSAMAHPRGAMHGPNAQDSEVDRLNEESYQAAQKGQAFSASSPDSNAGGMTAPMGSGSMGSGSQPGMSGGSGPGSAPSGTGSAGTGSTGSGGKM